MQSASFTPPMTYLHTLFYQILTSMLFSTLKSFDTQNLISSNISLIEHVWPTNYALVISTQLMQELNMLNGIRLITNIETIVTNNPGCTCLDKPFNLSL